MENVTIKAETMRSISKKAVKAFHCLYILRDFEEMLKYFMKSEDFTQFTKNLPTALSFAIGKAKEFHRTLLEVTTGANIRIDTIDGKKNYRIVAKGTTFQLDKLRQEIRSLMANNRALVLGRLPHTSSRYFIEGSSKLLSLRNTEYDSRVKFEISKAACIAVHNLRERVSVVLQDTENELIEEHEKQQYETFKAHLMEQMSLFPAENKDLIESLQVFTRFGCLYFKDVSASLPFASKTITFQELQIAHERGRRARKSWESKDFAASQREEEYNTTQKKRCNRREE